MGTQNDPYDNLLDAIERAYELSANSIEFYIDIILKPGNHYIKRNVREFYYKSSLIDINS